MNKLFIILSLVGIGFLYNGLSSCNSLESNASPYPVLQKRADTNDAATFKIFQNLYSKYLTAIKKDSNDHKMKLKLVELYINESRITGNLNYYNNASLKVLNGILNKKQIGNDILYQTLAYKATVLLSLHQFVEAKKIAEQALLLNPYDADIFGALVDANVELGNYNDAVTYCDKMLSIRPDIRSYARASYCRQLFGDNDGAKKAMRLAVESGAQGQENTEWARVQLGDLYLNTGHADTAKMLYESSLFARPNYPYAEMGLSKAFASEKKYDEAITHCKNAIRVMSESAFVSYLGELYERKGDVVKAKEIHADVLKLILDGDADNKKESIVPHNGNREIASAYLHTLQLDSALVYAKKDLAMRPNNMDANELLAWILFLNKDFLNAQIHIDKALINQNKNAGTLYKASLIYASLKNTNKANELKDVALAVNPSMNESVYAAFK